MNSQISSELEAPVLKVIENRRSGRAYSSKRVEAEKIQSLFEAARWAPSSVNEQPWVYIYATKDQPELWNKIFETLNPNNQVWAKEAHVLVLSLARKTYVRNGLVNNSAKYDLGAANAFLSLQAVEFGLNVHQMGGFNPEKAHQSLNIPLEYETSVILAIGYPGDAATLPENLKLREEAPRQRYTKGAFVYNQAF
jgi:nitroreductase